MTFPTAAAYPEQSQATTILVLGILGLICCAPLGIAAWVMGNKELQAIDAGLRNPDNRGTANAGRIIGIIGTVLLGVYIVFGIIWLALGLTFTTFSTS
jgi:hypothetical protein